MKPLKLTLSAFANYADKQEIDFTKLNGRNIFLVTGKTGAGKTTIFDAVSYALYGSPSGDFRDVASLRSDYADGSVKTYVELEFELRGKIYKIIRNPEQMLNKKKGDGLKKELAAVELYLPDGEKPLTRIKDVDERIKEILGVDKDQFRQIVMLPQGEFLKLLKASSGDREKIFRRIFGTESFNKIQDKLTSKAKLLASELKGTKTERDVYVTQIKAEENSLLSSLIENEDVDINRVLDSLEVFIDSDKKEVTKMKEEQESLKKNIKELDEKKRRFELDKKSILEFEENDIKLKEYLAKMNQVKEFEKKLESGRKAQRVKVVEDKLNNSKKDMFQREEDLKNYTLKEVGLKDSLVKAKELLEQEKLNKTKIESLNIKIEELKKQEQIVSEYDIKLKAVQNLERELQILDKEINRVKTLLTKSEKDKEELEAYIEKFRDAKAKMEKLIYEGKEARANADKLKNLFNHYENVRYKKMDHDKKAEEFKLIDKSYKDAKRIYEEADDLFRSGQAGILAQMLTDGESCPVCGSTEHPNKAKMQDNVPTEDELEKLKVKFDAQSKKRDEGFTELKLLNNEIEKFYENTIYPSAKEILDILSEDFFELNETKQRILVQDNGIKISSLVEQKRNEYKEIEAEVKLLEVKQKELELVKQSIKELTVSNERVLENKLKLSSEISAAKESLSNIEKQVPENLRDKNIIVKEKNSNIELLEKLKKSLDDAEKNYFDLNEKYSASSKAKQISEEELSKVKELVDNLDKEFINSLNLEGFISVDNYRTALSVDNLELIENRIKSYYENLKAYEVLLEKSKERLEEVEVKDKEKLDSEISILKDKILDLELNDKNFADEINKLLNRATHNKDCRDKIKEVTAKIKDKEDIYKDVAHLSSVANGDKGNDKKVSFESYILTSYFDEIILMANQRLDKMTNGRFHLKRKESEGKGNGRKGLELEVFDNNTGSIRGINSLSGGESFKAALSLALGLADVIQSYAGGISIDTMFVDEGFGTLDPESLDNAIECLLNLQKGGRLVGIISHVTELKERVDARLEVTASEFKGSKASFIIS